MPAAMAQCDPAPLYRVIELNGPGQLQTHGVNIYGEVVGVLDPLGNSRAFVWLPASAYGIRPGFHFIDNYASPQLTGDSWAYDINDAGQIVGSAEIGGNEQAFFWDLNGVNDPQITPSIALGTLGGPTSVAYAINNDSEPTIVGTSLIAPNSSCNAAFSVTPNTSMVALDDTFTLPSRAMDVSDTVGTRRDVGRSLHR